MVKYMLRDFIEYYPFRVDRVGNSLFKKIAKAMTSRDQKAKKAVDYVSGNLLYDNFDLLRRIVITTSGDDDECESLLRTVHSLEGFMKKHYEEHVDYCSVMKTVHSLVQNVNRLASASCSTCAMPQHVISFIKTKVPAAHFNLLKGCGTR